MNFIEAVIAISKRKDLSFCEDVDELNGKYSSICVYKNLSFIGKLRWPLNLDNVKYERQALVDELLEEELLK